MPQDTRLQILVVDDDPISLYTFTRLLRKCGHAVREAGSGAEAISLLGKHRFDAAVVDIRMPGVTGHDVAHVARFEDPSIFLIALSGFDGAADVAQSLHAGFDLHIGKSEPPERLVESLATLRQA